MKSETSLGPSPDALGRGVIGRVGGTKGGDLRISPIGGIAEPSSIVIPRLTDKANAPDPGGLGITSTGVTPKASGIVLAVVKPVTFKVEYLGDALGGLPPGAYSTGAGSSSFGLEVSPLAGHTVPVRPITTVTVVVMDGPNFGAAVGGVIADG